ncbi:MAG TPA: response regulator transcription factor [Solirubrobacteraceae bacterium]|nr:response regulator transcription factor [Solirubrobacteraceae bacterium]
MASGTGNGRRILACDDESRILRALKLVLRPEGYEVLTAGSMQEALDVVALSRVEGAIVDLVLPDGNGIDLCRSLREWSTMPIIVLSALGEEEQKVRALREGADDYITKPFGPQELVARLEAVLRRSSTEPEESVISAAGLEVDLAAHVVRRDGEEIHLTPTEFALLRTLVRNRGRLLTHRDLLVEVWGIEYADEVTVLRGQIANLRRKIEPSRGRRRHYVLTEAGIGYRFDPK